MKVLTEVLTIAALIFLIVFHSESLWAMKPSTAESNIHSESAMVPAGTTGEDTKLAMEDEEIVEIPPLVEMDEDMYTEMDEELNRDEVKMGQAGIEKNMSKAQGMDEDEEVSAQEWWEFWDWY